MEKIKILHPQKHQSPTAMIKELIIWFVWHVHLLNANRASNRIAGWVIKQDYWSV